MCSYFSWIFHRLQIHLIRWKLSDDVRSSHVSGKDFIKTILDRDSKYAVGKFGDIRISYIRWSEILGKFIKISEYLKFSLFLYSIHEIIIELNNFNETTLFGNEVMIGFLCMVELSLLYNQLRIFVNGRIEKYHE